MEIWLLAKKIKWYSPQEKIKKIDYVNPILTELLLEVG